MDEEKSSTITASPSVPGAKTSLYMGLAIRQIGRSPRCNALPLTFEAAAEDQLVHQKIYADTVRYFCFVLSTNLLHELYTFKVQYRTVLKHSVSLYVHDCIVCIMYNTYRVHARLLHAIHHVARYA